MGVSTDVPQFPVVDSAPAFNRTVANFNTRDLATWAAFTGVSVPLGYALGVASRVARPSAYAAGVIGGLAGFMYAYQGSAGRLMGRFANPAEAAALHQRR